MKKLFCFLSIATISLITAETNAQNQHNLYKNKFYIRGDIGASIPANKFKNRDNFDPYLTKKPKTTAVYNIGIGYKVTDYIRSDLNFNYRNLKYKASHLEAPVVASQKIKSCSVFLNGYFDFININKLFKPYLTVGIGYGQNKSAYLVTQRTDSGARLDYPGTKKNNFIWNAGFGTRIIINDRFNLSASYRYVDLGKVKTKVNPDSKDIPSSQKIKSHEIMGGIIINL